MILACVGAPAPSPGRDCPGGLALTLPCLLSMPHDSIWGKEEHTRNRSGPPTTGRPGAHPVRRSIS